MSRVSILVNSYNYAWAIRDAIDSALAQREVHCEIIVVDDGSTDDTLEVLAGYGDQIRVISQANGGQAAAMNVGYAAATADWILFLDADDRLHPLACAEALAAAREGVAKVQFRLQYIDRVGNLISQVHPPRSSASDDQHALQQLLDRGRYLTSMTSGNLYARDYLAQVMPIPAEDFTISADGYLNTLAPFFGDVITLDAALGEYRLHGENNWAVSEVNAQRLRRFVEHNEDRYRLIRRQAAANGLQANPAIALSDPLHLRNRLAVRSLTGTDPGSTEFGPRRSRVQLAVSGVRAQWRQSGLRPRSLVMMGWFAAMVAARGAMRDRLLQFVYVPSARFGRRKA